ncbi:GPW/gp25 family protein [Limobrevibacterium gyesilva]|uniref:GPW/gp25 family protein n=1 Tax=Limobrevibacterium gyesilva TaxID=2991712 RepID=A0AA41YRQ8_9PROT|nr:GPW/gp25 family protein [Limobrevibacterium gyesilva]MCW3475300.1 GPW/gp25 family protein [Limobrevibacterium gyesilva]
MTAPLHAIRYPFAIDAGAGALAEESDYETYIRQLIRQVLLTAQGERINRPDFGAGIRKLVFAPASPTTASLSQTLVYQALSNWLANLIRVEQVSVAAIEERIQINVAYTVVAQGERRFLNVEVTL